MDILWFWTLAGALALLVGAGLVRGMFGGAKLPEAQASRQKDIQIYRDQLTEVERDLARGTLSQTEAERVKAEIARRLIEADKAAGPAMSEGKATSPWIAVALVAGAMAGALVIYNRLGVPWYPDLPLAGRLAAADAAMASRPDQASAEAQVTPQITEPTGEYKELIDKLRAAVDPQTATDLQGLTLLVQNEAGLGNFPAARAAQARLITVKGEAASAEDHATYAEMLILAAGGYVSPQAEQALIATLSLDPQNGMARYFSGLMFVQAGRFDRGFVIWQQLLAESAPDARWMVPLRAQISDVAMRAGVTFELPDAPALPGPSASDIEAAAEMTAEERQQMVAGMVDGLMARLGSEGGTAEEWARLIGALATLGRKDEALAILTEAREIFGAHAADLALIETTAKTNGLSE
ncbi:c-type cytochrome biogenesis protein CcmI [Xinfangfangia sp. CPCC 101601]|uniref:C-type cytochrome biogenesis protein CcmI n=1 Tax=Pseudogemmobacter lacusdianii TaxID=3069608 RepID=A0ABU0VY19_9RHOB|nr:c-type cytochrome biogenesis protein CcmI [Xinfangfangia sp. CPCC 101601]MDQ2066632.1 c-type cytochrome biogenesis protein CcmI [Xinfangfangia sp. CPCC 101601]